MGLQHGSCYKNNPELIFLEAHDSDGLESLEWFLMQLVLYSHLSARVDAILSHYVCHVTPD